SRKKRASSRSDLCFSQESMTPFSAACSLRIPCAFSASFQNSGCDVTLLSSSKRFCLPSTSKTPPQQPKPLFQVGKLFFGFFQHCLRSLLSWFPRLRYSKKPLSRRGCSKVNIRSEDPNIGRLKLLIGAILAIIPVIFPAHKASGRFFSQAGSWF